MVCVSNPSMRLAGYSSRFAARIGDVRWGRDRPIQRSPVHFLYCCDSEADRSITPAIFPGEPQSQGTGPFFAAKSLSPCKLEWNY